jgi:hypothetical protein
MGVAALSPNHFALLERAPVLIGQEAVIHEVCLRATERR